MLLAQADASAKPWPTSSQTSRAGRSMVVVVVILMR